MRRLATTAGQNTLHRNGDDRIEIPHVELHRFEYGCCITATSKQLPATSDRGFLSLLLHRNSRRLWGTSRASGYVDSFALDSFRADKTLLFRTPLRLAHYALGGVTL